MHLNLKKSMKVLRDLEINGSMRLQLQVNIAAVIVAHVVFPTCAWLRHYAPLALIVLCATMEQLSLIHI